MSFDRCFVRFSPRFLVETMTNEDVPENVTYLKDQETANCQASASYDDKVIDLQKSHGRHLEMEIVEGELNEAPSRLQDNVLALNLQHLPNLDRFLAEWIGLAPFESFGQDPKDPAWKEHVKAGLKAIVETVMTDVEISDLA